MDFEKIKQNWHPISLTFIFFAVWLWSFPLLGPLYSVLELNHNQLFLSFLISHALGLLAYAYLSRYLVQEEQEIKRSIYLSVLLGIITIIFPYLPGLFANFLMVLSGLISAHLIINYLNCLGDKRWKDSRGRVLGLIFFTAGLISLLFMLLTPGKWMFILVGFFLFTPLMLPRTEIINMDYFSELNLEEFKASYWITLILLIIFFYVGGGLMYSLSYTKILSANNGYYNLGFLFYSLAVLPAGLLADQRGRLSLVNIGISLAGIGLLLLIFQGEVVESISLGLMQSAFAMMDIFLFLTLSDWASFLQNKMIIGIGLFINVITLYLSSWTFLNQQFARIVKEDYIPFIGVIFVLLIIPMLSYLRDTLPWQRVKLVESYPKDDLEKVLKEFALTSREREIISLLIAGNNTKEIVEMLSISYNTLKTHLKNIYRKTNTGGQTELILLLWKKTKN